jgi:hypothetical protein
MGDKCELERTWRYAFVPALKTLSGMTGRIEKINKNITEDNKSKG